MLGPGHVITTCLCDTGQVCERSRDVSWFTLPPYTTDAVSVCPLNFQRYFARLFSRNWIESKGNCICHCALGLSSCNQFNSLSFKDEWHARFTYHVLSILSGISVKLFQILLIFSPWWGYSHIWASERKNVISRLKFWLYARPQIWKSGGNFDRANKTRLRTLSYFPNIPSKQRHFSVTNGKLVCCFRRESFFWDKVNLETVSEPFISTKFRCESHFIQKHS